MFLTVQHYLITRAGLWEDFHQQKREEELHAYHDNSTHANLECTACRQTLTKSSKFISVPWLVIYLVIYFLLTYLHFSGPEITQSGEFIKGNC